MAVSKMPPCKHRNLSRTPKTCDKSQVWWYVLAISAQRVGWGGQRQVDPWALLVSPPNLLENL